MEELTKIVETVNSYISDYLLLFLLIGIGLYFSIRTKFVQVRCFGEGWRRMFRRDKSQTKGGLSSFQALTTAIAAQVGTGNIVGACGAILIGGPGAIFWMWIIAFFGMATIYAEAVLAQKTRQIDPDGTVRGGPVYYIRTAFKGGFGRFLAGFFAVASILALGFMGAMVQSNSISETVQTALGVPPWVMGLVVGALLLIILVGGVKRIGSVAEKIVPFMAILYIVGCVVLLCFRITYLPQAFAYIFKYAFVPQALLGGGVGALIKAITQGAKRGLFSNEAGMGSTPHAHALADVKDPHEQGIMAMIGVFIDTFIVLTMTALIVISTLYTGDGPLAATGVAEGVNKANMAQIAFSSQWGSGIGNGFVAICLFFFAFSTILSWNLFGKINFEYLFGKRMAVVYSIISVVFVVLGSFLGNDLVWGLTDLFNQLMVLPNALALVALGKMVADSAKCHKSRKNKQNSLEKLDCPATIESLSEK